MTGPTDVSVRAAAPADRTWIARLARDRLGGNTQVVRGEVFVVSQLPALVAESDDGPVGFLGWRIKGDVCEVMALASVRDGSGSARRLLDGVHDLARERRCREMRVVTTDDNIRAQQFYRRNGYSVVDVRKGAVDHARRTVKPQIPERIHDEIEYSRPV